MQRSFNGKNNNQRYPDRGSVNSQLVRKGPISYIDGVSKPVDFLPSPRLISN